MNRRKMTFKDAEYVFERANAVQIEELKAYMDFNTPQAWAKEITEYCPLSWTLLINDLPVAVFGAYRTTKTTLTAFCMTVEGAPRKVWGYMAKMVRNSLEVGFSGDKLKRVHAYICLDRPEPLFYAEKVGLKKIAELCDFGAGKDFCLMGMSKKEYTL